MNGPTSTPFTCNASRLYYHIIFLWVLPHTIYARHCAKLAINFFLNSFNSEYVWLLDIFVQAFIWKLSDCHVWVNITLITSKPMPFQSNSVLFSHFHQCHRAIWFQKLTKDQTYTQRTETHFTNAVNATLDCANTSECICILTTKTNRAQNLNGFHSKATMSPKKTCRWTADRVEWE